MNRLSLYRAVLGCLTTAALLPALLCAAPAAHADDNDPGGTDTTTAGSEPGAAAPPGLSTVGGELLGRLGTQVQLGAGAPKLPKTTARAWIVADADTGEVLAAHNAHRPQAPASTLKMLFAETLMSRFEPTAAYTALPEHFLDMGPGSSAVGVADGHDYTVDDLWHGVFLASGNDAVYALTALNGGKEKTVREMNERARELQALDTKVVNPDGYDGPGQVSSAYDLTLIARAGLENEQFRAYAATGRFTFPGRGEGKKREGYEIQSTNRLIIGDGDLSPYDGIMGVKNGYTSKAGYTFTGAAERDGRTLLVTAMDPEGDRLAVYRESAALLDWGFAASGKVEPVGELVPAAGQEAAAAPDTTARGGSADPPPVAPGTTTAGAAGREAALVTLIGSGGLLLAASAAYLVIRRRPSPAAAPPGRRFRGRRSPARPPGAAPPA
ncbi:D-alanyl-D-alanine carboxypeptidase family protein [Streptomyces lonarensis]|uniref:D-alanyl-D-alanine carboxypeptidase family protein n=1 Tax=Streptomyces lonarensis TaxID=700599 RepID=UPI001ADDAC65|nr:D-alanyl-D-alanine carboxypeptidase [Streptomyces lonarensis]